MVEMSWEDWKSLYSDDLKPIWMQERQELRKIAMLLQVFNKELTDVQSTINNAVTNIREQLAKINNEKENVQPQGIQGTKKDQKTSSQRSPLLFDYSDDDSFNKNNIHPLPDTQRSPKLSKNKKYPRVLKKSKLILNINNKNEEKYSAIVDSEDFMDISIIECTPSEKLLSKKTKLRKTSLRKNTAHKSLINSTLTQYFQSEDDKKLRTSDSFGCMLDQLNFSPIGKELQLPKKSEFPVDAIKIDGSLYSDFSHCTKDSPKSSFEAKLDSINPTSKQTKFIGDDTTFWENDKDVDKVSETCDEKKSEKAGPVKEKKTSVEKSNEPTYAYHGPVVRGKERGKLPGWSCNECKQFYELSGLNTQQLQQKINKCSKHRSKFQHYPDSPSGFWDLDFKSMDTSSEQI